MRLMIAIAAAVLLTPAIVRANGDSLELIVVRKQEIAPFLTDGGSINPEKPITRERLREITVFRARVADRCDSLRLYTDDYVYTIGCAKRVRPFHFAVGRERPGTDEKFLIKGHADLKRHQFTTRENWEDDDYVVLFRILMHLE